MPATRVEQEAGAGLDDRKQAAGPKVRAQGPEVGRLGGRVVDVEGQADRAIADLGQDLDHIFKSVVRKAVGVVADKEAHLMVENSLSILLYLPHLSTARFLERRKTRHLFARASS